MCKRGPSEILEMENVTHQLEYQYQYPHIVRVFVKMLVRTNPSTPLETMLCFFRTNKKKKVCAYGQTACSCGQNLKCRNFSENERTEWKEVSPWRQRSTFWACWRKGSECRRTSAWLSSDGLETSPPESEWYKLRSQLLKSSHWRSSASVNAHYLKVMSTWL